MIYLVGILVAVTTLVLGVSLLRRGTAHIHAVSDMLQVIRPLDVAALKNLTRPEDEDFLRRALPPAAFRTVQRQRIAATLVYLRRAFHNAGVLIRVADLARMSDAELAAVAARLADRAIRVRLLTAASMVRLLLAYLWPTLNHPVDEAAAAYTTLKEHFTRYALLAHPTMATHLTSVL